MVGKERLASDGEQATEPCRHIRFLKRVVVLSMFRYGRGTGICFSWFADSVPLDEITEELGLGQGVWPCWSEAIPSVLS